MGGHILELEAVRQAMDMDNVSLGCVQCHHLFKQKRLIPFRYVVFKWTCVMGFGQIGTKSVPGSVEDIRGA